MEEMILNSLSSLGFPAALCAYLLIKMNGTMEKLTEAIEKINRDSEQRELKTQSILERLAEQNTEIKAMLSRIGKE